MITEAITSCDLLSSSPDKTTRTTMQRTKSLDSKLRDKNMIDVHISKSKTFQRTTDNPRNAAESRVKSDSFRQALIGMNKSFPSTLRSHD
jgi:hypothetical protein